VEESLKPTNIVDTLLDAPRTYAEIGTSIGKLSRRKTPRTATRSRSRGSFCVCSILLGFSPSSTTTCSRFVEYSTNKCESQPTRTLSVRARFKTSRGTEFWASRAWSDGRPIAENERADQTALQP